MIALNRRLWAAVLACLSTLSLMTACSTAAVHDSYSGSKDTLGRPTRSGHLYKDIVLTFPAWVNESEKLSAIEASAKIRANTKCSNSPYLLTELLSEPVKFYADDRGASIISANISCKVSATSFTEKPPVNSFDSARLAIEVENERNRLHALETPTVTPPPENIGNNLSLDVAKKKCTELGFKTATEGYGKCVLQLSK